VDTSLPPAPLADAFVNDKLSGPLTKPTMQYQQEDPDEEDGKPPRYYMTLSNTSSGPRFYPSPDLDPDDRDSPGENEFSRYSFYCYPSLNLTVQGTVVWVVPEGFCLRKTFTVKAHHDARTPPTLIIVAKANGRDPGRQNRGIWLQGALDLAHNDEGIYPRVYLVSQGDIGMTHDHSRTTSKEAETMSIVAGGSVELEGPVGDKRFRLGYDAVSMDALADQLLGMGALPPTVGGGATAFAAIRGHWRETTPR
jgi:hypothetical protein